MLMHGYFNKVHADEIDANHSAKDSDSLMDARPPQNRRPCRSSMPVKKSHRYHHGLLNDQSCSNTLTPLSITPSNGSSRPEMVNNEELIATTAKHILVMAIKGCLQNEKEMS